MRIFVTGATGFIGSHFVRLALAEGHEVIALKRPNSETRIQLNIEPQWLHGSLCDDWSTALDGCDALFHFAAQGVSPQETDWNRSFKYNVWQSIALIESALKNGVARIVACGSCMEYGKSGERFDFIPVNAPLEPVGPYATSKAAFTTALAAMVQVYPMNSFQLLRPFHIFGEGQHESNLWPSLRRAALHGENFSMTPGEQIRDFMEVQAVAARFLESTKYNPTQGQLHIQNIGSGNPISLCKFAQFWWNNWNATGKLEIGKISYRNSEVMRYVPAI